AVKLARRYGKLHLNGAYLVITGFNSFHGRTLAMVAATGQRKFQEAYSPVPDGFINVDYNNIEAIMSATTDEVCAVMLEPIQGEGGVNIPDGDYFKKVRHWCDQKGILLILDEVQTGLGRTGTLWGYQQIGVEPDIMTLAKGLGSGFPIGAIMATDKAAVFKPGDHGSTFGGNPLACAAAYAAVNYIIEHEIPARVARVGRYLMIRLDAFRTKYDFVTEVRGRGLLVALQFNRAIADQVVEACLKQGLLLNPVKPDALRFMPPLIITETEVDEAVVILDRVLARIATNS
ncbi:MAG: aminotransferase class III-fold pyridoxal phosphate-dependent enzyme, partial [Dehalococcoidia bacterium]|nr:aminotransferase class III-fold pyridoxal phosphate-dependent enzyme [Dehalococcoidia bacterium]